MLDLAGAPIARSITAWHCHVFDNVRAPPIADSSMLYTDRNCPSTEAETRPAGAPPRAWCVFACDATNSARCSHLTPTCAAAGLALLRDNSIHERSNTHLLLEVASVGKDPAHVVGRSSKSSVVIDLRAYTRMRLKVDHTIMTEDSHGKVAGTGGREMRGRRTGQVLQRFIYAPRNRIRRLSQARIAMVRMQIRTNKPGCAHRSQPARATTTFAHCSAPQSPRPAGMLGLLAGAVVPAIHLAQSREKREPTSTTTRL